MWSNSYIANELIITVNSQTGFLIEDDVEAGVMIPMG